MKYSRIAILLTLLVPCFLYCADAELPTHPEKNTTSEPVFKKPKEGEPVFPLDEMISKPLKNNDRLFADLVNMMFTLGMIIGLILIVAWFLKRLVTKRIEQGNENSLVNIVERRTLSPRSMLYIIEIDDRRIVLAESPTGVTRVSDYRKISAPIE